MTQFRFIFTFLFSISLVHQPGALKDNCGMLYTFSPHTVHIFVPTYKSWSNERIYILDFPLSTAIFAQSLFLLSKGETRGIIHAYRAYIAA